MKIMMNKNKDRALAHIELIHDIQPIIGADNIEMVHVLGWGCIAKKQEFKDGDKCVYIEIDSKVPETECFEFLRNKGFKIKTMKLGKFGVISQGIALPLELVGLKDCDHEVGEDVTKLLKITKIETSEEKELKKAEGVSKQAILTSIKSRKKKFFENKLVKKLMRYEWFRNLIIKLFARKKDKPRQYPSYITKTDETRIENLPWILQDKQEFIMTEKIDGTSTTFAVRRIKNNKYDFIVCSRNVRQADMDQSNFHTADCDGNVYWQMAIKYDIKNILIDIAERENQEIVILQGETIGNVQGNPYKLSENKFYCYNLIFTNEAKSFYIKKDPIEGKKYIEEHNYKLDWVPILNEHYVVPDTIEEIKKDAEGMSKINPKVLREGVVCRSYEKFGDYVSFKNVANSYLLKKAKNEKE